MLPLKIRPCDTCGKPTQKRRRRKTGWLCLDCAAQRIVEANVLVMYAFGPDKPRLVAEAWKRAMQERVPVVRSAE